MKIYYATQANGKRIAEHQSGVLEPMLIEQPPDGYEWSGWSHTPKIASFIFSNMNTEEDYTKIDSRLIKCKHPSSEYRVFMPTQVKVGLEVTGDYDKICTIPQDSGMIIDLTVEVKRVKEISMFDNLTWLPCNHRYSNYKNYSKHKEHEIHIANYKNDIAVWWNARHKKQGERYEDNPYVAVPKYERR